MKNEYTTGKKSDILKRYAYMLIIYLLIAVLYSLVAQYSNSFIYSENNIDVKNISIWLTTSVIIPSIINYFIAYITGLYILPLSNGKYMIWIIKNNISNIIFYFITTLAIVMGISAIYIGNIDSNSFIKVPGSSYNEFQSILMYLPVINVTTLPLWMGYKSAWSSYVGPYRTDESFRNDKIVSGTRDKQDMYIEYSQFLETKNIGQTYDKYVENPIKIMTGADGSKPRWFFSWFFINLIAVTIVWSFGIQTSSTLIISLALFFISPTILLSLMSLVKIKDMTSSKKIPILHPKIGYSNENNYYNLSDAGTKKYERVL